MNRNRSSAVPLAATALLALGAVGAHAQNLLTTNPNFAAGSQYNNPGGVGAGLNNVPGWDASFTFTGNGGPNFYYGADNNQTSIGNGTPFGYIGDFNTETDGHGGVSLYQTQAGSRAAVTAGSKYTLTLSVRSDEGTQTLGQDDTGATVGLFFYANNTAVYTPITTFTQNINTGTNTAFTTVTVTGTAPAGASFAAASLSTTGRYILSNASIVAATPEPSQATAFGLAFLGLGTLMFKARKCKPAA